MRPFCLHGHQRSVNKVRLNRDGDLLFSCAKDKHVSVYWSENGERLGTYGGKHLNDDDYKPRDGSAPKAHNGAIWDIAVSWDSAKLVSGSGDMAAMLWDVSTGTPLHYVKTNRIVKAVDFSYSGNLFFLAMTPQRTPQGNLAIFDVRDGNQMTSGEPGRSCDIDGRVSCGLWSQCDDIITLGFENGQIYQYEPLTVQSEGDSVANFNNTAHKQRVHDIQLSSDMTMMITASKDQTAKLLDARTLEVMKTYTHARPVNSAAISPTRDHVLLGGGEEAMNVTQTALAGGHFESKFYHLLFEDEFMRIKGHFGPINTLAFHPSGDVFITGGEDGYVRINFFDPEYYDFDFEC